MIPSGSASANNPDSQQRKTVGPAGTGEAIQMIDVYRHMVMARELDRREAELVSNGEAFFHVSGAGHEGTAILNRYLTAADWLHCHYRDKALMLGRGVSVEMFFHSSLCNAASHSAGRQMCAHMSDPERRVLSLVGPVGNNALQAVGVAAETHDDPAMPIVVCSVGDGTSQQGEFLEAVADAVRDQLRVLFLVHDNEFAISTGTQGRTWYSLPAGDPASFYGVPIIRVDGRYPHRCLEAVAACVERLRAGNGPALLVFSAERLSSHTNADDERTYRTPAEIAAARATGDPIQNLRAWLESNGSRPAELRQIDDEIREQVEAALESSRLIEDPVAATGARAELSAELLDRPEYRGNGDKVDTTMLRAIQRVLRHHLDRDSRVSLYGQDIEDPKGDVFGVTKGLSTDFPKRVRNSPLTESTIVGRSIGRALAGGLPVAFLQFADFLPLAYNQLSTELGSMHWRTNGSWKAPVIVLAPCGGYRPGLGPFHAHTFESIVAHIPGLDVVMPSTAGDAAGLLNAAFATGRPTVFLYPKVCLNDRERATSSDLDRHYVPIGKARHLRTGDDLTLVTYGSTVNQCERAADLLAEQGLTVDLIDLRSLSPWDQDAVATSARRTGRLLVVHEDNLTCSMASEIVATTCEAVRGPLQVRRVTRPDTYVPCNFANQLEILPSIRRVVDAAADMLGYDIAWELPPENDADIVILEAQGSSPADQAATVAEWRIKPGDRVEAGEVVAEMEADKGVYEYSVPNTGVVDALLIEPGIEVKVGTPILRLRLPGRNTRRARPTRETPGVPVFSRRRASAADAAGLTVAGEPVEAIYLGAIAAVKGAQTITNQQLGARFGVDPDEIYTRTGILARPCLGPGQDALTIACDAARQSLARANLTIRDIDAIICHTTTPLAACPSMACRILHDLCANGGIGEPIEHDIPAHDVLAACTGYLYALAQAWDFVRHHRGGRVLVITTETLSTVVDPGDFDTAILFGDAATATVVGGGTASRSTNAGRWYKLHRPVLGARGENGDILRVGFPGGEPVQMNGRKVFTQAVRRMEAMLNQACQANGIKLEDLDLIVPHQANGRIIEAIEKRLVPNAGRILNSIEQTGNTSSSSIPLALSLTDLSDSSTIGLCAFGGGYTFGAAILTV